MKKQRWVKNMSMKRNWCKYNEKLVTRGEA